MAFKAAFLAHAPDAEPERHRCVIETSKYKLFVVLVRNQEQAIEVCQKLVKEEGVHSILLCPGFTHSASDNSQAHLWQTVVSQFNIFSVPAALVRPISHVNVSPLVPEKQTGVASDQDYLPDFSGYYIRGLYCRRVYPVCLNRGFGVALHSRNTRLPSFSQYPSYRMSSGCRSREVKSLTCHASSLALGL